MPPAGKRMNLVDDLHRTVRLKPQMCPVDTGQSPLLRETFADACGYISAHFANPLLDPGTLARELRCSRATLYRAFVANHISVAAHIQRIRFQNVLALFARSPPRIPVSTIAANCGFECLRHFSRRFKQVYGVTPGACRDALRSMHVVHQSRALPATPAIASDGADTERP